jgi:hypothetical protein
MRQAPNLPSASTERGPSDSESVGNRPGSLTQAHRRWSNQVRRPHRASPCDRMPATGLESGCQPTRGRWVHVSSVGATASVWSIRRRNDVEDVIAPPSCRARSTSRRSEVTTLTDCGTWSSPSIRTISWSAASRPRQEANATTAAMCAGWDARRLAVEHHRDGLPGRRGIAVQLPNEPPNGPARIVPPAVRSGADQVHAIDQPASTWVVPAPIRVLFCLCVHLAVLSSSLGGCEPPPPDP